MLVLNLPFKALMFLTLMRPSLVLFLVLWLKLVKDFLKVRCRLALLPFLISCLIWLDLVASLPLIKERILVIILLLHFLSLMLGSVLVLMLPLLVWLTPDLRIKKSLLKCNWTIRKRLPRCKMRLKKRLLAFSRRLNASNLFLSLILHLGNLFLIVQLHFSKLVLILKSGVNLTSSGSISTSTLPSINLRKCSSKIITSILSFISGRLATKSNQIKQLIRNGRSASLQRTFKKSFTSFSHSTRNKTRDGLIRVRNIRALNGRFNTSITHAYSIVIGSKHITLNATGGGFLTASKQFRHGATSKSRSNTASNTTKHKSPHLSGWRQIISLIT